MFIFPFQYSGLKKKKLSLVLSKINFQRELNKNECFIFASFMWDFFQSYYFVAKLVSKLLISVPLCTEV